MTTKFLTLLLLAFVLLHMADYAQSRLQLRGMQRVRLNAMKRRSRRCPYVRELEKELKEVRRTKEKTTKQLRKLQRGQTPFEKQSLAAIKNMGRNPANLTNDGCKIEFDAIKQWPVRTSTSSTKMAFVGGVNAANASEIARLVTLICDVPEYESKEWSLAITGDSNERDAVTGVWKPEGKKNALTFFRAVTFNDGEFLTYAYACTKYTLGFDIISIAVPDKTKTECTSFWWLEHCKTETTYKIEVEAAIMPTGAQVKSAMNHVECEMAARFRSRFSHRFGPTAAELAQDEADLKDDLEDLQEEIDDLVRDKKEEQAECDGVDVEEEEEEEEEEEDW